MTTISTLKKTLLVAMLTCIAMPVFAEDAPVYDVDSYSQSQQFDGQGSGDHGSAHATGAPGPQIAQAQDSNNLPQDQQMTATDNSPAPQAQTLSVEQRVARLESSVHADVTTKVADLQTELQTLRGEVEDLTHQLQQMQTQQKAMYSDLDKRIGGHQGGTSATTTAAASSDGDDPSVDQPPVPVKSKKGKKVAATDTTTGTTNDQGLPAVTATSNDDQQTAPATPASTTSTTDQPNVAEEQQIYQTAYNLIKAKKYNDAADTLQKMLDKYPSGQFAANAHYWLGELYGLMGKNEQSVAEFSAVVKNYPESPKISDAQLKLGLIYAAQLKWPDAKTAFKKVINHYPGTSSAHLASEQLKQIKQAGH
jgi:tol-pal system protein YbgF